MPPNRQTPPPARPNRPEKIEKHGQTPAPHAVPPPTQKEPPKPPPAPAKDKK
jgi:hypothetical protein